MKPTKAIALTLGLLAGALIANDAAAASRFGPAGLGANLHRRFVIKQAVKNTNRGVAVRNRAITWYAKPYLRTNRSVWRRY